MLIIDAYREQNRALHGSNERAGDMRLALPVPRPDALVRRRRDVPVGEGRGVGAGAGSTREQLVQACA